MKIRPNLSNRWKIKIFDPEIIEGLLVLSNLTKGRAEYLVRTWNNTSTKTVYFVDEK